MYTNFIDISIFYGTNPHRFSFIVVETFFSNCIKISVKDCTRNSTNVIKSSGRKLLHYWIVRLVSYNNRLTNSWHIKHSTTVLNIADSNVAHKHTRSRVPNYYDVLNTNNIYKKQMLQFLANATNQHFRNSQLPFSLNWVLNSSKDKQARTLIIIWQYNCID